MFYRGAVSLRRDSAFFVAMPFQSRAQQRFAFGTKQPWAKRWAKETTFAGLPERKDAGTDAGAPLHGPGGLLATPGMGVRRPRKGRKWGMRLKDKLIKGKLYRADDGKFSSGSGSSDAPVVAVTPGRRGAKRPKQPRQTDAQRQEARAAKRQQNTADVAKRMADTDTGLSPSGVKALTAFASGTQPDPQTGAGLAKMGLAEQALDGSYRMSATGRAAVDAMAAGDYQRTVDAISRGTDASGKRTQRQTERAARQAATAAKRQEAEAKRQARRAEVAQRRTEAAKRKKKKQSSKKPAKDDERQANIARNMQRLSPQAQATMGRALGKLRTKAQMTQEKAIFAKLGGGGSAARAVVRAADRSSGRRTTPASGCAGWFRGQETRTQWRRGQPDTRPAVRCAAG